MGKNWTRIGLIALVAITGIGSAYSILSWPDSPRGLIAVSGLLLIAGLLASGALAILAWSIVADDLRPRFRCGQPGNPMALAQTETALIGQRRYRNYGIRWWAGITLSNKMFIGIQRLEAATWETFSDPRAATISTTNSTQGEG
jgi:hypothetical protein